MELRLKTMDLNHLFAIGMGYLRNTQTICKSSNAGKRTNYV